MPATPDDPWGPIGAALLRWLVDGYGPTPGGSASVAVLIALGALLIALGTTVYTRLRRG